MSIFKKKEGIDVLDLTLLQKRGILKVPEIKEDFIDLTKSQNTSNETASSSAASPFSFLDSLAQSNSTSSTSNITSNNSAEVSNLRVQIDNLEFKIERLLERLDKIESKLGNG